MTRDETIDMIRSRAQRPGNTDHLSELVLEWNLAQTTTFERGFPKYWFLLDIATVTVDATGFRAPTPEGFLELFEEAPAVLQVASDGASLHPLERISRSNLEWSLSSPNTNSAYDVMEGYVLLATALPVGTSLRVLYYKSQPTNTMAYGAVGQPAANRWCTYAADLMIGEVGRIFAGAYLRDQIALGLFDTMYQRAYQRLLAENTSRKEMAHQRFLNGAMYPIPDAPRTVTQAT